MKKTFRFCLCAWMLALSAAAAGKAERVVVVVWDGMRPDFVRSNTTPTLFAMAQRGVTFSNSHAVYPSSTEVNGTAIATGLYPGHSGIMGNREYRPAINPSRTVGTEDPAVIRRGDDLTAGHYIAGLTIAETLQRHGHRTVVASVKPVGLLHDRGTNRTEGASAQSVVLVAGKTVPSSALGEIVRQIGPLRSSMPRPKSATVTNASPMTVTNASPMTVINASPMTATNASPVAATNASPVAVTNASPMQWTTRAMTDVLWTNGVPAFSLLWLSEPDATQHGAGPGSPAALAAIRAADDCLKLVLDALDARALRDSTDVMVLSDHGFSSVSRAIDPVRLLRGAGVKAAPEPSRSPSTGDVVVVSNGGSVFCYVNGRDEEVTRKVATAFQRSDMTAVVFSRAVMEGVFPLDAARIDTSEAPDVVAALSWGEQKNRAGAPGSLVSSLGASGMHASLSRYDMRNTMVAAGPDWAAGFVDTLPSGNVDVAPTILHILGVAPAQPLDGRILSEAFAEPAEPAPEAVRATIEASRRLDGKRWTQILKTVTVGTTTYIDQGYGMVEVEGVEPSTF